MLVCHARSRSRLMAIGYLLDLTLDRGKSYEALLFKDSDHVTSMMICSDMQVLRKREKMRFPIALDRLLGRPSVTRMKRYRGRSLPRWSVIDGVYWIITHSTLLQKSRCRINRLQNIGGPPRNTSIELMTRLRVSFDVHLGAVP